MPAATTPQNVSELNSIPPMPLETFNDRCAAMVTSTDLPAPLNTNAMKTPKQAIAGSTSHMGIN